MQNLSFKAHAGLAGLVSLGLACGSVTEGDPTDGGSSLDAAIPDTVDAARPPGASLENSSISGQSDVVANGEDVAEIVVELRDEFGNAVMGVTPEFRASGEGNAYGQCTATDRSGISTCGMTSTGAGEKVLEITEPLELSGDTVRFLLPCDNEAVPFGGGDGTADDPYRLCTPAQLNRVGINPGELGSAFVVARDIDLADIADFNIIGDFDSGTQFTGNFDGGGFVIRNLTMVRGTSNVALFSDVGKDGVIQNVRVQDVNISGQSGVGGLAARNAGEIRGAYVSGTVVGTSTDVGGLVGDNVGVIANSHAAVEVTGASFGTGGLVGQSSGGSITGSSASGDVSSTGFSLGGLVGSTSGKSSIEDSYATGAVLCEGEDCADTGGLVGNHEGAITGSHATGSVVSDGYNVGGLVGQHASGTIFRSYATGAATSNGDRGSVGGLAGSGGGSIVESFATGDVVGGGPALGGLVGFQGGNIRDSYAVGTVTGDAEVGGLVGSQGSDATVTDAYAAGEVNGGDVDVGGLVGFPFGTLTNSYWDRDTSGIAESDGGTPLPTADFADSTKFEDWNFDGIWNIGEAPDEQERPVLQWQPPGHE